MSGDATFGDFRLGATSKQAETITEDEESLLWSNGLLGVHSAKSLLNQRASEASELSYVRVQSRFEIYALDVRQPLCACLENHC